MLSDYKWLIPKRRAIDFYQLVMDFLKKCNDDHVAAFGAMSAFFFLLSLFPFMIFFLTITKFLPFTKMDIEKILMEFVPFENGSIISTVINEIYHKTGASVFTVSIVTALWSSSRGVYSIVKGLNSVYDIDDTRNYFVLRLFSALYTVLFALVIVAMLILWVFGNKIYVFISLQFPFLSTITELLIHRVGLVTLLVLVIIFMLTYQFIPGRESRLLQQYPGAIIAGLGWLAISKLSSFYIDHFSNFTYVYGSMAGIMILLIWMYFCMCMIFYGAEFNYFLENKTNYHTLIRIIRPNIREVHRQKLEEMKKEETGKEEAEKQETDKQEMEKYEIDKQEIDKQETEKQDKTE